MCLHESLHGYKALYELGTVSYSAVQPRFNEHHEAIVQKLVRTIEWTQLRRLGVWSPRNFDVLRSILG